MLFLTVFVSFLSVVCGSLDKFDDKVIGGKEMSIYDSPQQCSLQYRGTHFCGGALIDSYTLISASHCFRTFNQDHARDLTIRCGSSFRSKGGFVKQVESFLMHPEFDTKTMQNDIALVKVTSAFIPSARVKIVEMASKTPADGTPSTVSGWGRVESGSKIPQEILKSANLNIVSNARCGSSEFEYGRMLPKTICATGDGVDACQGDSGGPLVVGTELVGIVSYGTGCALAEFPGVYTDVAAFKDWVNANL